MNWVKSRPDSDSDCTVRSAAARVAVGQRLAGREHQLGVGHAEDLEHVVELHLVAAVGHELLERPERVAERAGGRARQHAHRGVGDLDALLGRHALQHARDLLERGALEVEAVAAVDDRGRHLVRLGRRQHEHHVLGRLLERLQERVPGRRREHVRLVEDVDALAALHRRERHVLAQLADVVDRVVRRRVHLDHVERGAAQDRLRDRRLGVEVGPRAALGVQRAGEELRHGRLAGAARADEQIGVMDLVELDRVAERLDDVLLAHHRVECPRAVAAVEREHR